MTRTELREEIRRMLRDTSTDTSRQRWTDTDLNSRINWAQLKISTLTRCLQTRTTTNITSGTSEYTFATDFLAEITVLYLDSDSDWKALQKITEKELDLYETEWRSTDGTPTHYYIRENQLGLYPNPDVSRTNALRYDYYETPDDLSADSGATGTPFNAISELIPFHDIITIEVARKCKIDEGLFNDADKLKIEFDRRLREMKHQLGMKAEETRIINIYETARSKSRRTK